jgi:glycosyltransferase involved in cell wall biosynthesis
MKTSIIICTYNEEKTIADVLISICRLNPDSEIIVVDDGSTDNTESILRELSRSNSFRYERFEENKGKSWAMAHGVEISTNEIILFFDADVSNIKKEHFKTLLNPVIDGYADMVLGQPSETLIDYRINPFKILTGERALLKKDILPILDDIRETRFGVETFLNLYYQAQGKKIKYLLLNDLKHPTTYEKSGSLVVATKKYLNEGKEIVQTLLKNQDLIHQRVELLIQKTNDDTKKKLDSLQGDINKKLQELKEKFEV